MDPKEDRQARMLVGGGRDIDVEEEAILALRCGAAGLRSCRPRNVGESRSRQRRRQLRRRPASRARRRCRIANAEEDIDPRRARRRHASEGARPRGDGWAARRLRPRGEGRRRAEAPRQSRASGRPLAVWLPWRRNPAVLMSFGLSSPNPVPPLSRVTPQSMYPGSEDAGDATGGQAKFEFLTLKARSSDSALGSRW